MPELLEKGFLSFSNSSLFVSLSYLPKTDTPIKHLVENGLTQLDVFRIQRYNRIIKLINLCKKNRELKESVLW